jgi:hypothetical protein
MMSLKESSAVNGSVGTKSQGINMRMPPSFNTDIFKLGVANSAQEESKLGVVSLASKGAEQQTSSTVLD